jgi:alcohol dehydrogenase, propanol-preferring
MKAMRLRTPGRADSAPLVPEEVPIPAPEGHQVLVRVERCGVCRTDLHVVEGDLLPVRPVVTPGHEIVGRIERVGSAVDTLREGERVGIPWLHSTCGRCEYCRSGRENLCERKQLTGYTVDGGYAQYAIGEEGYVFPLPNTDASQLAPLLCAGIIGFRAVKLALPRPGGRIGFFGFGGSAHLALQIAVHWGYETYAYSRTPAHLELAKRLGATEAVLFPDPAARPRPPHLDGAVVFSPAGETVLGALAELKKGGRLSIAAIHLSPIPTLEYDRLLFGERSIASVEANTREDAREFLELAGLFQLTSTVSNRPLAAANEALRELKEGKVSGALVLDCSAD